MPCLWLTRQLGVSRTLHLYAESDDRALAEQVREAVSGWPDAAVNSSLDAGWRAIRHLTG